MTQQPELEHTLEKMRESVLLGLKEAKNDAIKRYLEEVGSSASGNEEEGHLAAELKEDMSRK